MYAGGGGGSAWKGMNVEQGRAQAQELKHVADELNKLMNKIEGEVTEIQQNWNGADSTRFVQEWNSNHKAALTKAQGTLEAMSSTVTQQAAQQDQTSA